MRKHHHKLVCDINDDVISDINLRIIKKFTSMLLTTITINIFDVDCVKKFLKIF